MELVFVGGGEYVKLRIDRIEHTLEIGSSKTDYVFVPQPYAKLFDNKEEQAVLELVDDQEFVKRLKVSFQRLGYRALRGS